MDNDDMAEARVRLATARIEMEAAERHEQQALEEANRAMTRLTEARAERSRATVAYLELSDDPAERRARGVDGQGNPWHPAGGRRG